MVELYSAQSIDNSLLYVSWGKVYIEKRNDSLWNRIVRIVLSILGIRNYSITGILKNRDIRPLAEKQAIKCGLGADIVKIIYDRQVGLIDQYIAPENHKDINKKLIAFATVVGRKWGANQRKVFDAIRDYTYKIKHIQAVENLPLDIDIEKIPADFKKMSLSDMRKIESMEKNRAAFDLVDSLKPKTDISRYRQAIEKAENFSKRVRTIAARELGKKPFSISCYDFDSVESLYGIHDPGKWIIRFLFTANVYHTFPSPNF